MADMLAISQLITSLKAAKDIAAAAVELRDSTAFLAEVGKLNAQIVEAQNSIFAIQQDRSALVDTISDLKKRIADLEAWETEKQRYQLAEIAPGIVCYELKEGMSGGEPPHRLCANCYTAGQKRFLQAVQNGPSFFRFRCNACTEEVHFSRGGNPPVNRIKPTYF
ncbi:hypothetical protein IYY11_01570 [Methylocystis sp. H62]|uniref:hypothetical protein n=1 Tax=Methylocystis sp. H62 TaxID=2785789 RepID=UPI0018C34189|nr:hypothetical protein [Methylocystis sp. H62]MBG0792167.1 hypothetical protein [Methylocystis sp. H62]